MPEAKKFLKQLFGERGGYVRLADSEKVTIDWIRGEDPRFELTAKDTGNVVLTEALAGKTVRDIEVLLETHGFTPVNSVAR